MQALLFSVPIAPMFASTIRTSRASMISRSGMSVGWLKKRRSGGTPVRPEILLRGASSRSATRLVAMRRSSGSSEAEELGGLVEVGLVGARLGDCRAELVLGGAQERVDVLELGAASLSVGDRDRADHGVVEVAARGLVDLVLVDVQERGDDVLGDLRGLDRQRPVADQPQRRHPERRVAEVEEPDALAAVARGDRAGRCARALTWGRSRSVRHRHRRGR